MRHHATGDPAPGAALQAGVVVAVGVSSAVHIGKLPVAVPALQSTLGLSLLQAGFLLSLVQLAGVALGLFVGLTADRLGPRRVMLSGLLLLAAASALGAVATDVQQLLWTRALEGLGFLLAVLPAPALMRLCVHHPPTLARALGWWGAYMPVGAALALLLGAPLIGLIGWRGLWMVLSALTLVAAALLGWAVPPPAAGSVWPVQGPRWWPRLRRTLVASSTWWMALAFFCYSGQWLAVIGFLPTIYSQAGITGTPLGVLSALAAGVNMTGNIAAGRLLARGWSPGALLSAGYLSLAVGALVAFGAQGHPVAQYLAVLLFSSMGGLIPGTLFGLAVQLAPGQETVSTTVGWMQQWSSFGQFLGPPLVAWLAMQVGGWHWTWTFNGLCSLAGLWLAWRLQRAWAGK
jgi:MFS family permease